MSAIITTPEDVQRYVREAVTEAVRSELPALVREATSKPMLSKDEVLALTGWKSRKLQYLRDRREIAFVQTGKSIVYPRADLLAYLECHRVLPRTASRGNR